MTKPIADIAAADDVIAGGAIAETVMEGLKQFQRNSVLHIVQQFYGGEGNRPADGASGRFLVADETGLGKSVVARGVIAHTLDVLRAQRPEQPVNVVYLCSNLDLARQNLSRLNVSRDPHAEITTRLTLLATEGKKLQQGREIGGGELNLISFTPGTSFSESGQRAGKAQERALIVLLLERWLQPSSDDHRRLLRIFRGGVTSIERFRDRDVRGVRELVERDGLDPVVEQQFRTYATSCGVKTRLLSLMGRLDPAPDDIPRDLWGDTQDLIGDFRGALAKAGVETLKPDLIILDEFQRFRHLLDIDRDSEAAQLAQALFEHENARVLLLSATPYKPFTRSIERDGDPHVDFLAVVRFLLGGGKKAETPVERLLEQYRGALTREGDAAGAAQQVRAALLPIMSRAERPAVVDGESLVQEKRLAVASPTSEDFLGWLGLRKLADSVGTPVELDRWKSVPYFASFMSGYQLGSRVRERLETEGDGETAALLQRTQSLPPEIGNPGAEIDPGNAKLRALLDETVGNGWWKAIWVPPSMPYLEPGKHYRELHGGMTKQVVFSSWSAVPTAVAALVSREALRLRMTRKDGHAAADEADLHQLDYRMAADGATPQTMSTFTLFWPHPGLAAQGDQVEAARRYGRRPTAREMLGYVRRQFSGKKQSREAWEAFFDSPRVLPDGLKTSGDVRKLLGDHGPRRDSALHRHIHEAVANGRAATGKLHHPWLSELAVFAPGNTAYRAVRTIAGPQTTDAEVWAAAFVIAAGLRSLFTRGETVVLLNTLDDANDIKRPYWQKVLAHCADGNLQAVLDEYLFQLHRERGGRDLDGDALMGVAEQVASVLGLVRVNYRAHDTDSKRTPIELGSRWALRYGDGNVRATDGAGQQRQTNVRAAFNSPFAPFVLATTSAGQEGIDFHWWSHAVVHWNLPSNPVDFEQREGRVNRFAGHAIRKNVAEQHWVDALAAEGCSTWEAAFAAAEKASADIGDFAPWWVYPGSARIHRVLTNFPLSIDEERYQRLKHDLVLYRLTLGQPRQEDMLDVLNARGRDHGKMPTIDLAAPVDATRVSEHGRDARSVV